MPRPGGRALRRLPGEVLGSPGVRAVPRTTRAGGPARGAGLGHRDRARRGAGAVFRCRPGPARRAGQAGAEEPPAAEAARCIQRPPARQEPRAAAGSRPGQQPGPRSFPTPVPPTRADRAARARAPSTPAGPGTANCAAGPSPKRTAKPPHSGADPTTAHAPAAQPLRTQGGRRDVSATRSVGETTPRRGRRTPRRRRHGRARTPPTPGRRRRSPDRRAVPPRLARKPGTPSSPAAPRTPEDTARRPLPPVRRPPARCATRIRRNYAAGRCAPVPDPPSLGHRRTEHYSSRPSSSAQRRPHLPEAPIRAGKLRHRPRPPLSPCRTTCDRHSSRHYQIPRGRRRSRRAECAETETA